MASNARFVSRDWVLIPVFLLLSAGDWPVQNAARCIAAVSRCCRSAALGSQNHWERCGALHVARSGAVLVQEDWTVRPLLTTHC